LEFYVIKGFYTYSFNFCNIKGTTKLKLEKILKRKSLKLLFLFWSNNEQI